MKTTLIIVGVITLFFTVNSSEIDYPNSMVQYELKLTSTLNHPDPRENITAKYNTCDFDLVQTIGDESLIQEFSEQCQAAYQDPVLKNLLLQESNLFQQIMDKIHGYEKQQDPVCDPSEPGRQEPCPAIDYEMRYGVYNATDIMICQNSTDHVEYANCMIQKRNDMIIYLNEIV